MKKLMLSSILLSTFGFANADGWVNYLTKEFAPKDFTETYILFGPSTTTQHYEVDGFSDCQQFDGDYPSTAPWSMSFQNLFTNTIKYQVSGYINSGQSSVTCVVDVETALNSDGTSAWEGWYDDIGGVHENQQIRKIEYKTYDLPSLPGGD